MALLFRVLIIPSGRALLIVRVIWVIRFILWTLLLRLLSLCATLLFRLLLLATTLSLLRLVSFLNRKIGSLLRSLSSLAATLSATALLLPLMPFFVCLFQAFEGDMTHNINKLRLHFFGFTGNNFDSFQLVRNDVLVV